MQKKITSLAFFVSLVSCSYYHDTPAKNDLALEHANLVVQFCGADYVSMSNLYKGRSFSIPIRCKKTKALEKIESEFDKFIKDVGYVMYYGKLGNKYITYCYYKTNLQVSFSQNYQYDKTLFEIDFFYASNRELNCPTP
jgi:hypothetical protein